MTVRSFITLLISIIIADQSFSQSCNAYYPMNKGARWVMETYDNTNNLSAKSIQTVKGTSSGVNGMYTARMQGEVLDHEDKILGTNEYEVKCQDGNFYISMDSFLNPKQMEAYQDMEVAIDGDFLELPSDLEPGMTLPAAAIEVKIQSSGVQVMNMTIEIINRQVEKFESVTTPAGTFECAKITYTSQSKMGAAIPINVIGSGAEWLAKNTGMVKSEQYDEHQKLMSYSLLTEFSR